MIIVDAMEKYHVSVIPNQFNTEWLFRKQISEVKEDVVTAKTVTYFN